MILPCGSILCAKAFRREPLGALLLTHAIRFLRGLVIWEFTDQISVRLPSAVVSDVTTNVKLATTVTALDLNLANFYSWLRRRSNWIVSER